MDFNIQLFEELWGEDEPYSQVQVLKPSAPGSRNASDPSMQLFSRSKPIYF